LFLEKEVFLFIKKDYIFLVGIYIVDHSSNEKENMFKNILHFLILGINHINKMAVSMAMKVPQHGNN
jgi:hypothetical protein